MAKIRISIVDQIPETRSEFYLGDFRNIRPVSAELEPGDQVELLSGDDCCCLAQIAIDSDGNTFARPLGEWKKI